MKVEFLDKFYKDLDKLRDKKIKKNIIEIIDNIEEANSIYDIKNIRKMKGYKNSYRIRLGDYRIGLFYEKGILEFARIAHRKEIYKIFP